MSSEVWGLAHKDRITESVNHQTQSVQVVLVEYEAVPVYTYVTAKEIQRIH